MTGIDVERANGEWRHIRGDGAKADAVCRPCQVTRECGVCPVRRAGKGAGAQCAGGKRQTDDAGDQGGRSAYCVQGSTPLAKDDEPKMHP